MTLKDFLNFIRWKNVLMIVLIMCLIKYVLFERFELSMALDHLHFGLLTLSILCIAIAGYIINDIQDVQADKINKPGRVYVGKKISRTKAYNLFIGFNSIGLVIGMYLSYHVGHTSYFIIYVLTSLLLYQYAKYIKKRFLIGNLLVSFAIFLSIMLPLVFDLLPVTNELNEARQMIVFKLVTLFGLFGFLLTLLREVVKDMEDVQGDKEIGARSIPISLGLNKTKGIVAGTAVLVLMAVAFFAYMMLDFNRNASIYLTLSVGLPLIAFIILLLKAQNRSQLHRSSALLKIIMLTGTLTILLI